jgi:hypothetical protein
MLKKTTAPVQLGVIRSEATAPMRRVFVSSNHAIMETFSAGWSVTDDARKRQPVRNLE